ncbi:Phragmoplast orienting kinesin 2 [Hordeum vulgare]|nr:Phragmoplast orienting kinesin 2 [Hordeum vulgare]
MGSSVDVIPDWVGESVGPVDYGCVRRCRHRRLTTYLCLHGFRDALRGYVRIPLRPPNLLRSLNGGRHCPLGLWDEAIGYVSRFLRPVTDLQSDEAQVIPQPLYASAKRSQTSKLDMMHQMKKLGFIPACCNLQRERGTERDKREGGADSGGAGLIADRGRRGRGSSDGPINELPEVLLSDILSRLGTTEAARTVILSTRFCDAWLATPLRLDDLELPVPACGKVSSIQPWTAHADVITHALDSHPAPSRSSASLGLPDLLPRSRRRGRGRQLAAKNAREVSLFFSPEWCHDALADPLLGCPTLQSVLFDCPAPRSLVLKHVNGLQRIRVCSCCSLVLLGVWHYKQVDEITVEDAPCVERLLGNMRLNAAITVTGAPKLTAFGYAVTGSGKTHTMLGEISELGVKPRSECGMAPRIFQFLIARIRTEEESRRDENLKYNCKCSFLKIYNEQITDLLDPSSTNLQLREDTRLGVYVENLTKPEVTCVSDIITLLMQGSVNRKVSMTH